ncbi:MAG: PDZ domain-containing protein [Gemmatimonadota bacterium]|nr:PDZ domain-containing protein [Gemmatimonadota bacterium]
MRALLILSGLLGVASSDARAQTKAQSKPDSGCVTSSDGRVECIRVRVGSGDSTMRRIFYRSDSAMMNRAALGIELRATGTRRDTLGVFVAAVTPRGPAETAGIIEGDRIAAINGVDLRSAAADVDDAYTNGIPAHRLSREVRKLTPGARVTLRVYSAGRFRDFVVTAGRASEVLRRAGGFNFRQLPDYGAVHHHCGGFFGSTAA